MTAGVTAPLTAIGALSARTAANFDQAMQKSIAVMGDVDATMREDLEATARDVANTTTVSAQEAADAYYYLASAGLDAAQSMEVMPRVAEFAEAGQMNMAEATDVATNVMSAFGLEASEMTEVTDTLTETVSNHNQTMQDMSTAMSTVAPVASSLGVDIEETSAAIGQMGDVGIQGERAGTALRNVLSQLSDESSTAATKLEEMGVKTRDSQGNLLSLTKILQNMEQAGVAAGDAASIFGTEAGPAMAALMQEGSSALQENTNQIRDAEGATKSMAATQRDTLNAEMQIARSNIEDAGIAIGTVLMPMLSTATGYVQGAAEWFQNLNSTQQKTIIALAGVAAATGPVLLTLGTMAQSVVALSSAYGVLSGASLSLSGVLSGGLVPSLVATQVALGPITVPIWAIIGALGALVGIVAGAHHAWTNNIFGIRDTATNAFQTVKGWLDAAPTWLLGLLGPLGILYGAWRENLFGVQDVVGNVFDWIGDKIGWLVDKIQSIPGIDMGPSDPSDAAPDPGELGDESADAGAQAGQDYADAFETNAQPDPSTMTPDQTEGPIKGEPTEEMRAALVDGVDGYKEFDSTEEVEDAPTKINEALFDAVAESGGASAETLGVSESEFQTLRERFRDGSPGSTGSSSGSPGSGSSAPASLIADATESSSNSGGAARVVEELKQLRDLLTSLTVEGNLEVDDEEFERFLRGRIRAEFGEERDRFRRGVGGGR
ncbi:phage tail tape measure protein [Halorussus halobius]|uniref:phage tail tape measure protein n=1 Tax=Halorussus halobius TaxID=1710537 RepID=UPI001092E9C0|nr:phage tail tape measure protein [Halorussus halobius]